MGYKLNSAEQNSIDKVIENLLISTGFSYDKNNLLELAEKLGLKVMTTKFKDKSIRGFIDPANAIYINAEDTPKRQNFTLAHEIGHYKLHGNGHRERIDRYDYSYISNKEEREKKEKEETEANYFAASLLVPANKLKTLIRELGRDLDTRLLANYFNVYETMLRIRIKWVLSND